MTQGITLPEASPTKTMVSVEAGTSTLTPDAPARDRILTDLDTNFLVEAGAGSGKTTLLVGRLCALIARGAPIETIAAVTFTRKAANELRERFQGALESRIADPSTSATAAAYYSRALRNMDHAFLGTIHAFCARILRERAIDIPLDPVFQELDEESSKEHQYNFWRRWIEETRRSNDSDVLALVNVGINPQQLLDGFKLFTKYPDVEFETTLVASPDHEACRRELEALLMQAESIMPNQEPDDGWDELMQLVQRLQFQRHTTDWGNLVRFCTSIERISTSHCKPVLQRWSSTADGKKITKTLGESFKTFLEGPAANLLQLWRAYRYPFVIQYLRRAAERYARERYETGQLGFEDLLLLTARLLREQATVRQELGLRYRHLLVDEFQDTDPVQAEVCLLLASEADQGNDWRRVVPRPGALFVVGDPKQSIYRFRRADIQIYQLVKQRMKLCGDVLSLTSNFRSVQPISALVNSHFKDAFPTQATDVQAAFSPMHTVKETGTHDGVFHYTLQVSSGRIGNETIVEMDANRIASWIANRIATGERSAGDFLILTRGKGWIGTYARALSARNIPVVTTGARLPQERELQELLAVLHALADPENPVAVAAALEGLFFGHSPADLLVARRYNLHFSLTHPPREVQSSVTPSLWQLHNWWKLSQREAADVLIERILGDTGLLFHAASQPLGDSRVGALLHLVEVLRDASGITSGIVGAMDRIELLLDAETSATSLQSGRTDTVRIMNVHKAKGLEGDVVILAAPIDVAEHDVEIHVTREEDGHARGGLCIGTNEGRKHLIIAHPPEWESMCNVEQQFGDAEETRLLYVAVTRARREILVVRRQTQMAKESRMDNSPWSKLGPSLAELSTVLELVDQPTPEREKMECSVVDLSNAIAEAKERVITANVASFQRETVTESLKEERFEHQTYNTPFAAGTAWGRAVHRAIEAMGRGRSGEQLARFVRAVVADEQLDPEYESALCALLSQVERSPVWTKLTKAEKFAFELPIMRVVSDDAGTRMLEGVIDAISTQEVGWQLVDWKTDTVEEEKWHIRAVRYQRQVETYREMMQALTGQHVAGRLERVVLQDTD